jgi:predicted pyridoxine 5'-phosphate oxidase superfamily flavin-nucleotide-binding protein
LTYTQPPPLAKEEIEVFLTEMKIARFCSLNEDGTIHVTPVWFRYKNGLLIIGTPAGTRKVKNVKRNKKVTVIVDDNETAKGILIYGDAELDYHYSIQEATWLYEKYMPPEEAEQFANGLSKASKGGGVKITVRPYRMVSFDTTKDNALRTAAQG